MIMIFFLGFGIGLSTPFLLKKYFNNNDSNVEMINSLKGKFDNELSSISSKFEQLSVVVSTYKKLEEQIDALNGKISEISKNSNDAIISEWLYGREGGDMNESS